MSSHFVNSCQNRKDTRLNLKQNRAISTTSARFLLISWRLGSPGTPGLVPKIDTTLSENVEVLQYNFISPGEEWIYFAAIASISVALSDTLASEIGSLDVRTRSITTLKSVPAGTNGGMSPTGTVAALFGAIIISLIGMFFSPENSTIPEITLFILLTIIGWLGCQIDSLLGALLENRGYLGKHSVNFLATLSGSLMAIFSYHQFL